MVDSSHSPLAGVIDSFLEAHLVSCELGPRTCIDCAMARSGQNRSLLARASLVATLARDAMDGLPGVCVYCGDHADSRDHLLPKGWSGKATRRFVPVLPACSDCNVRINDFPSYEIHERAAVVAASLRKRYRRALAITDRTTAELMDFGPHLRSALIAKNDQRRALRARLVVLDLGGMPNVPEYRRKDLAA